MHEPAAVGADRVIALIDGTLRDDVVGPDAMRWCPGADIDIRVGDIVDYHGSIVDEHGECIVVAVDPGGRLGLRNLCYPETELTCVRRSSVTPTGRWAPVCRCGHPHVHPYRRPTGHCPCLGCGCPHHP
ncbi:hypothetical protein GZH49_37665 [Nocardia terpenica]|uniref:hypothetical protein n=1 Tax=Nocardia terpenica TaxID=455432 RepID=UPI002FE2A990